MKPTLNSTRDYSQFEPHEFNRNVTRTKDLESSMRKYGFDPGCAIHCIPGRNGKMKIKQGHHRFEIAQKIGLPIWYILCDDLVPIPELEWPQHQWRADNYVQGYTHEGTRVDYQELDESMRATGLAAIVCASALAGRSGACGDTSRQLRRGTFEVTPEGRAQLAMLTNIVRHCEACKVGFAKKRNFLSAIRKVLFVPEFDPETFKKKVSRYPSLMVNCATQDQFLTMIEAVYNHGSQKKIPLIFRANEMARERCVAPAPWMRDETSSE